MIVSSIETARACLDQRLNFNQLKDNPDIQTEWFKVG
jgi:hypothetical protein